MLCSGGRLYCLCTRRLRHRPPHPACLVAATPGLPHLPHLPRSAPLLPTPPTAPAAGFRGRAKNCIRIARERVEKSLQYAFRDRKAKKRDFRALWITRISAGTRQYGVSFWDAV